MFPGSDSVGRHEAKDPLDHDRPHLFLDEVPYGEALVVLASCARDVGRVALLDRSTADGVEVAAQIEEWSVEPT